MLAILPVKPCPFCGADGHVSWVMHEKFGKSIRVQCSRDGECPSPSWTEYCEDHESDADCLQSVVRFWNTRAEDWASDELVQLRVKLSAAERRASIAERERDRAQTACEQIAANYEAASKGGR